MSTIGIDIRLIGKKQTGSEVVFFNLVKNLALIDKENRYHLFTDLADQVKIAEIGESLGIKDNPNFEIIVLRSKNKFSWNFWTIQKHLRKNPVDIYLTQYITPFFVPRKIKIATIVHDVSFKVYKQFIKKSDLFFLNLLIPRSLRRADKVIGVSKFTEEEIMKYYGVSKEKMAWFYNAVSDDFLRQETSAKKISEMREKYALPENFLLYIGTMQPRKNLIALIEAYAIFKLDHPEIKLVLAGGKGHNYDRMIDRTIKTGGLEEDVIFPGFIDEEDKAALMKAAEIFCFPSFYEGFGIPILEAMSAGVPVVASDIPPHREVAQDAALFFDPYIPGEMTEKLNEIAGNNMVRESLIAKGKDQVGKFSWTKTAEKMLEIFTQMK